MGDIPGKDQPIIEKTQFFYHGKLWENHGKSYKLEPFQDVFQNLVGNLLELPTGTSPLYNR